MAAPDLALRMIRTRLFVVSYAALWFMFAARFGASSRWEAMVASLVLGIVAVADGRHLVRSSRRRTKRVAAVSDLTDQGGSVSSYLATYLLPFLGSLPQNLGDWIAYGLYFAVALIVYVNSDLALVNPTLYCFGYHVERGKVDRREGLIISRYGMLDGDLVRVSEFAEVFVVHERVERSEDAGS